MIYFNSNYSRRADDTNLTMLVTNLKSFVDILKKKKKKEKKFLKEKAKYNCVFILQG